MALKGKIVFVTGASAGIGAATALAFAAEGARLLLAARRVEKLAAVAKEALQRGAEAVHTFSLDVRDRKAVEQALAALPEEWAAIDILVNNAGLSRGLEKLYQGSIDDWEEMLDTNVKGLLYVTRAVVPGMVERGRGHVVNLGSTAGEMTYPGGAVYCASKAAERAINDGLRHRSAGHAGPRDHGGPRHGGDRVQHRPLSRRHRARPKFLQRDQAAHAGRRGRRDCVGRQPPGACQHCAGAADPGAAGQLAAGSPGILNTDGEKSENRDKKTRFPRAALVDCLNLSFDLLQRRHECRAPRRIRGFLREDIASLQIQRLFLAFPLRACEFCQTP